jgi:hypothetical protein
VTIRTTAVIVAARVCWFANVASHWADALPAAEQSVEALL